MRDRAFRAFSERGAYPVAQVRTEIPWGELADFLNETSLNRRPADSFGAIGNAATHAMKPDWPSETSTGGCTRSHRSSRSGRGRESMARGQTGW